MLSQAARLLNDICAASIELQALALRLNKCTELSTETRQHAASLAHAGRAAALAAVAVNGGRNPRDLILFYGQYLSTVGTRKVDPNPLNEQGVSDTKEMSLMDRAPLAVRRAAMKNAAAPAALPAGSFDRSSLPARQATVERNGAS